VDPPWRCEILALQSVRHDREDNVVNPMAGEKRYSERYIEIWGGNDCNFKSWGREWVLGGGEEG